MQPSVPLAPSAASAPAPSRAEAASTATELVTRPEPGLARGAWEAPPWLFWAFLGVVVLGAGAYLTNRLGVLRLAKKPADTIPPSTRARRP